MSATVDPVQVGIDLKAIVDWWEVEVAQLDNGFLGGVIPLEVGQAFTRLCEDGKTIMGLPRFQALLEVSINAVQDPVKQAALIDWLAKLGQVPK